MIFVILFRNTSRYSKDTQQLPSEIIPRRTVETHPRSTRVPLVHHRLKAGVQTLAALSLTGDLPQLFARCIQYLKVQKRHLEIDKARILT
jgi:hypothetical protein